MRYIREYKWLILIVLLAAVLRFWQLGKVPPSPDWDEAALGYNAYSILKTGRDEFGEFLPRVLRSFDDYKPPLYAYLAIPSVAIFGLNTWSVRLPSAVMGVLAVVGTYFLVIELFKKWDVRNGKWDTEVGSGKKRSTESNISLKYLTSHLPLLTSFLLAISPWHLQFSRIAFEANVGLTINIWAFTLFLKGLHKRWVLALAALLFGLGFYAYHSERIFLPIMALVLAVLFRRRLFADKKAVLIAVIVGFVTVLPLIPVVANPTNWTRLAGTSSLADKTGILMRSVAKLEDDLAAGRVLAGKVFENRRVVYAQKLLEGYLSHYSLRWLFLTGDNDRHHAPDIGLLYLWELPFVLYGIFFAWIKRDETWAKLLLIWFVVAPIAASPTSETPHAIRTLVFLPTLQIFTALGTIRAVSNLKSQISNLKNVSTKFLLRSLITLYILFLVFNISYYFHMYFNHMNYEYSRFWQYGYKQAVDYVAAHRSEYQKVVVSTKLEQPHMFFLFYLEYDPVKYLAEGGTASGGFAEWRNRFETYEFRAIDWDKETRDGKTLFIGTPKEITSDFIESIRYLDGSEAMRIAR